MEYTLLKSSCILEVKNIKREFLKKHKKFLTNPIKLSDYNTLWILEYWIMNTLQRFNVIFIMVKFSKIKKPCLLTTMSKHHWSKHHEPVISRVETLQNTSTTIKKNFPVLNLNLDFYCIIHQSTAIGVYIIVNQQCLYIIVWVNKAKYRCLEQ